MIAKYSARINVEDKFAGIVFGDDVEQLFNNIEGYLIQYHRLGKTEESITQNGKG